MDQSRARATYGHGVVATALKCRQCRYELRGLNAAGLCPECGLSIWASVQHATDPEGTRLPQLRNPKAVGSALLWLVLAGLIASVLWSARSAFAWLDRILPGSGFGITIWTPPHPRVWAAAMMLSTLFAVWRLFPPRKVRESGIVRRDLRLLFVGLIFSGLAMLELAFHAVLEQRLPEQWTATYRLVISLSLIFFLVIALIGLQGVLRLIGQRSRQYRTARDSRQNVHGLIAVLCFVGLGLLLEQLPDGLWPSDGFWSSLSMVMVAISYAMFVVGLVYLFINTIWIHRVLRKQPPTLDELLLPPEPAIPVNVRMPDLDTEADRQETEGRDVSTDGQWSEHDDSSPQSASPNEGS